ncbi:1-deoxy-D-xylulose-5-phosphate reductoisomerase [Clostridium formicaceticum]|uniref:1-deoxy-D-xylulose 5-phosphate reductoisomerase n=1 Tax=Clostridium formicaceticum TaxID=1497 RepID=A0AAC9WGD8_9CLOT|nr:1-deoxy-D-xylulose-5-phosphate reductoisomerase [Clostridium formicaceticum]AOY77282.1 1-deoxy-D-xylulose-5-phosphate reductoisomerase [Clostridium formicaceticum]ARE87823.1 1-deoxy-D-xylulose 5-phosphate reductoisomerase [Clostridium formicaceticum]
MTRKISILGSTGSIGKQTLEIVGEHPEKFKVVGLAVMQSIDELEAQIRKFQPKIVAVFDKEKAKTLAARVSSNVKISSGIEGLIEVATYHEAELVLNAVVGSIGLLPTLEAVKSKKTVALANKETLVAAGELVMKECHKNNVKLLPVDSEHSAVFQCLNGEKMNDISKIILTASGGPFREWSYEEIEKATFKEALKHPNWNMGQKISIDSATLMNKGLEVIEAKWLFHVDVDKIEVIIHPQSIIHSMIELKDFSIIAQLGVPNMKLPIQYALSYPERVEGGVTRLDFKTMNNLTFIEPDVERFPCLALAYKAMKIGGTMPCVLNAANEMLVDYYLKSKISFYDIPRYIERVMEVHQAFSYSTAEELQMLEQWVRSWIVNELR